MLNHRPAAPTQAAAIIQQRLRAEDAKLRDAARKRSLAEIGLTLNRQLLPNSTAESMAGHMIDIAAGIEGNCTDADLMLRGFSAEEIAKHGDQARLYAYGLAAQRATQ